ncbi:unnamed protein product, partial [Mesorhabditis belari]|uniref:EF-hand domain-containing protein n=1 Tax=Mesorhabditis belari TaxID=2138241 RepID=A0AAF3F786_9BILA
MKTLLGQKLDNKRLQCVIDSADKNGDKVLDFDEFLALINR